MHILILKWQDGSMASGDCNLTSLYGISRDARSLTLRVLLASIGSLICLNLISCKKASPAHENEILVAISAEPSTLDPRRATDATSMRIANLLFSSLVRIGPGMKPIAEVAESWTFKDLEYHFVLRPNLKFHDGSSVTKEDIEFSFEEFRKPGTPFASSLKSIESLKVEYSPLGGSAVFKLKQFSATFLTDLSPIKILPKKTVVQAGDEFGFHPVGSGPFAWMSANANEIRLKTFQDCAYAHPRISELTFKIIRDESTRYLKVLKGEVDLAQQELPPNKIISLEKEGFKTFKYPGLSMTYLLINHRDPILSQLKFRQALNQILNRDEIIKYKLEGLAQAATSLMPPKNPFYFADLKASATLTISDIKSIFKDKSITLKSSNLAQVVENAKVIASQALSAGLKIDLQSYEWATFFSDINQGRFQIALMKWVGTTDPDLYRLAFHSKLIPPQGKNRGAYKNTELDPLLDQGLEITEFAARFAHYKKVQEIVFRDLAIIPLWYEFETAVVGKRVANYVPAENGDYTPLTEVSVNTSN